MAILFYRISFQITSMEQQNNSAINIIVMCFKRLYRRIIIELKVWPQTPEVLNQKKIIESVHKCWLEK